jgi:hypothetical protein
LDIDEKGQFFGDRTYRIVQRIIPNSKDEKNGFLMASTFREGKHFDTLNEMIEFIIEQGSQKMFLISIFKRS